MLKKRLEIVWIASVRIATKCLRVSAILGKVFTFEELTAAAEQSEDALLDALDEARNAQLIAPARSDSFSFTHDKIREVLYEELNPIRRRRLHRHVAEGLEAIARSFHARLKSWPTTTSRPAIMQQGLNTRNRRRQKPCACLLLTKLSLRMVAHATVPKLLG